MQCELAFGRESTYLICRKCGEKKYLTAPGALVETSSNCSGQDVRMCAIKWVEIFGSGFVFECCPKCLQVYDEIGQYTCRQSEYPLIDVPVTRCPSNTEGCECANSQIHRGIVICPRNAYFRRFKHHILDVSLAELIDKHLRIDPDGVCNGDYYFSHETKMTLWATCHDKIKIKEKERTTFLQNSAVRGTKVSAHITDYFIIYITLLKVIYYFLFN